MTTVTKPRADARAGRRRRRTWPPRLTAWLFYAVVVLALAVTIVTTAHSGAATCIGAATVRAAQLHAQSKTCAPAITNPVPGRR